ncbi:MAG TPA: pyridoxamine 5'-phosphate oxidase family protein [Propionibacteriaceae bacterium]|nr:pyridoxamine 5'-phosphate oxidase family protein [Propionibacteriaceae bacterium]
MSSTSEDSRSAAPFRELPSNECERRLGQHTIGRVAWNAPDGPQLLPVNYAYYNKTIVFRTVPDGVMPSPSLHRQLPGVKSPPAEQF